MSYSRHGEGKNSRPWQTRDIANNVLRSIQRHAKRAGHELTAPNTVHRFRKRFGQNHADNGTPIHVLQQAMGHANITTTRQFYVQVTEGSEQRAAERYETLVAPAEVKEPGQVHDATDAQVTPEPAER